MQPAFLLKDEEAEAMTKATADLFDCLEWNITGDSSGKPNIYIAAFLFAVTIYRVEAPRAAFMVASSRARNVTPTAPATASEATARVRPNGMMDFSGDIEAQVNNNTSPTGEGVYRFN